MLRNISSRIAVWFARLDDRLFDIRYGTDTGGAAFCSTYDVIGENKEHGTGFQSSRPTPFRKVIQSLGFPPGSVFVDIGSGKGRMVLMASDLGFKKVVGLEFIPVLCDVAKRNIEIYRRKGRGACEIEIHAVDATAYEFTGEENVFYFSNPFDGLLMQRCLDNIARSLRERPRKAWLVYMNPQEHKAVVEHGLFRPIAHHHFAGQGRDFRVYIHEQ